LRLPLPELKKKCLYSKYYEKFTEFTAAIADCLEKTSTIHKTEINTLVTLNFQMLDKAQIVGG